MQSKTSAETTRGSTDGMTGDAIDVLLRDHTRIKALLEELTGSPATEQQAQTLDELKQLLTIHNATEENFVYPAIAKIAGHKHESEHLYHETAEADMAVFELDIALKTGDIDGFAENAKKLQAAILEHIDDEEQKAFPQLRERAQPEQAQMLAKSVSLFRSSLKFSNA
jgi:hemerythrin superfamily protein